jgi:hypothetical protein
MTTPDIMAALQNCSFTELNEIRAALDAKIQEAKDAFMAQAQSMGLSCSDGNGKKRGRRANAKHTEA